MWTIKKSSRVVPRETGLICQSPTIYIVGILFINDPPLHTDTTIHVPLLRITDTLTVCFKEAHSQRCVKAVSSIQPLLVYSCFHSSVNEMTLINFINIQVQLIQRFIYFADVRALRKKSLYRHIHIVHVVLNRTITKHVVYCLNIAKETSKMCLTCIEIHMQHACTLLLE